MLWKFYNFAKLTDPQKPGRGQSGRSTRYWKAFTKTHLLDDLKSGKFRSRSRMWQMVDAMRICYIRIVMAWERRGFMFIHIQRRLLQDAHST